MTKAELLERLRKCRDEMDIESGHIEADKALVEYVGDPEIAEAYFIINKWYA